ncbi:hypothetical protein BJ912DRAFT_980839 [Pholiota molesta]|nr:hypothetical protein BJ912DRAFT_980839 [Pholiota molesta]
MIQVVRGNVVISLSLIHTATALPRPPTRQRALFVHECFRPRGGPETKGEPRQRSTHTRRSKTACPARSPAPNTHPARRASSGPAAAPMRPPTTQTDRRDHPRAAFATHTAEESGGCGPRGALARSAHARSIRGIQGGEATDKSTQGPRYAFDSLPRAVTPYPIVSPRTAEGPRKAYTGPTDRAYASSLQRVRRTPLSAGLATRSYAPPGRPPITDAVGTGKRSDTCSAEGVEAGVDARQWMVP